MAALPYMPLYVADYIADTQHLSTLQHGAYLLLIMHYWRHGKPLPADDETLARIAHLSLKAWKACRPALQPFFAVDIRPEGALWRHPRVDEELGKAAAKSLKSKEAAAASVKARRNGRLNGRSADVPTITDINIKDIPSIGKPISGTREKRKSKLPINPSPESRKSWGEWAVANMGWTPRDTRAEIDRFVDSALANERRYSDWMAAWRNWCRSQYCQTKSPDSEPMHV